MQQQRVLSTVSLRGVRARTFVYDTCRARWNLLGLKSPDAARQITTLCRSLRFYFDRADSFGHRDPPRDIEESQTRHGIFF